MIERALGEKDNAASVYAPGIIPAEYDGRKTEHGETRGLFHSPKAVFT